ncbi:unnamed protein product, partial [Phaeothamnion confervicola]
MLMQGFGPDIKKLVGPVLGSVERKNSVQFIFVTATLTKAVRQLLEDGDYPKVRTVETRDVHKGLPSMKHAMVDTKGRDKLASLLDVLHQNQGRVERTLVFCNTVKSCQAVEHAVREAGLDCRPYHGEVPSIDRAENLRRFKLGEVRHLVATDIAARGLDMPNVAHVINFDFPLNPIDYLHRSGRTARMGATTGVAAQGRVTSLLAKRDRVLATAIEKAVLSGGRLDELSSRREDYLEPGQRLAMPQRPRRALAAPARAGRGGAGRSGDAGGRSDGGGRSGSSGRNGSGGGYGGGYGRSGGDEGGRSGGGGGYGRGRVQVDGATARSAGGGGTSGAWGRRGGDAGSPPSSGPSRPDGRPRVRPGGSERPGGGESGGRFGRRDSWLRDGDGGGGRGGGGRGGGGRGGGGRGGGRSG